MEDEHSGLLPIELTFPEESNLDITALSESTSITPRVLEKEYTPNQEQLNSILNYFIDNKLFG